MSPRRGRRKRSGARRSAKKNPALVIFGNPPRGGLMGDVKAIVYRHAKSGELMVHGFGPKGEAIELEDLPDGVAILGLPFGVTGAKAIAQRDGTVLLRSATGKRLWADL